MHYGSVEEQKSRLELCTSNAFDYYIYIKVISGLAILKELERISVLLGETICCRERQCVTKRESVCRHERQCVSRKDNVSPGKTACRQKRQCIARRDSVSPGETMLHPHH